eukprot:comp23794_c1_seq1/m.41306 comp23794_c1_seq1/g.41306  ORF comp23794_c1_seq1/g.41306 comp23794_c1_seq1/m.41306 type:complete len:161 (-) comp23794_c1_seq1:82-564(-)
MTAEVLGRLSFQKQSIEDSYAEPANFLEIDVVNPITHGEGRNRYTDYEVRFRTNLPIFKNKEFVCRRRFSDFEWLKLELERDGKIVVPQLPSKAISKQMSFWAKDDGIFDEAFVERRMHALEEFINKIAGHPLAQNEKCLHMFLNEKMINKNYTPGKVRN